MRSASYKIILVTCLLISLGYSLELRILGAAYGKADVTNVISAAIKDNSLTIQASNEVFGDSWYGTQKALVIVYQFGDYKPLVATASEHKIISITEKDAKIQPWMITDSGVSTILGAAYGLAEVTRKVQTLVDSGVLNIQAQNKYFGDSWVGVRKTLVVVYKHLSGVPIVSIVEEDRYLDGSLFTPYILP